MELQKEILGLSIAYALLAALLLVIALRARIPWPLKIACVLVTSAYYCVAFFHVEGLPGWSATARLPPQFQLLWARVVEPNPVDRDPGAVHIWVEDLDAANLPSGQPRAYRLPYSAALAAKVEAARDEIMKGHPQGGRAADFGAGNGQPAPEGPSDVSTFRPAAAPGGDPAGGGPLDLSFLTGESGNIKFAPLPVPILPAKDTLRPEHCLERAAVAIHFSVSAFDLADSTTSSLLAIWALDPDAAARY